MSLVASMVISLEHCTECGVREVVGLAESCKCAGKESTIYLVKVLQEPPKYCCISTTYAQCIGEERAS